MSESRKDQAFTPYPDDPVARLLEWAEQIKQYEAISWERMPEIDLYMDQVITYMDKQLHLFQPSENGKLLTSSMINNYVKDGLLPRPDHKKYNREHLAGLMVIGILKQVLSIPDIAALFKALSDESSVEQLHDSFCSIQKAALDEVSSRVEQTAAHGESQLKRLAFTLSVEATARQAAAERILSELQQERRKDKEK
ncbi:MAG: DUF1836 domain-containing protein [Clostridiales bacterium]|jgi:hypothetical protein|nr:DUF1836 domain-containing protein [Clostridiales bacterium]